MIGLFFEDYQDDGLKKSKYILLQIASYESQIKSDGDNGA